MAMHAAHFPMPPEGGKAEFRKRNLYMYARDSMLFRDKVKPIQSRNSPMKELRTTLLTPEFGPKRTIAAGSFDWRTR